MQNGMQQPNIDLKNTTPIETEDGVVDTTYYMGGGIMIDNCLPEITYNYIRK